MAMNQTAINISELMMAHGDGMMDVGLGFRLADAIEQEQTALLLVNSLLRQVVVNCRKEEPDEQSAVV